MRDITIQTIESRMESLGLAFMAAGFESYLADASRNDKPLKDAILDLLDRHNDKQSVCRLGRNDE